MPIPTLVELLHIPFFTKYARQIKKGRSKNNMIFPLGLDTPCDIS